MAKPPKAKISWQQFYAWLLANWGLSLAGLTCVIDAEAAGDL